MISIATRNTKLAKYLTDELSKIGAKVSTVDVTKRTFLTDFYNPGISAIVVDESIPSLPAGAAVDIFNSLARRIPLIVVKGAADAEAEADEASPLEIDHKVTCIAADDPEAILATIKLVGGLGTSGVKSKCPTIPFFNLQIPIGMLKDFGALGILTVDASNFSKVGMEYGPDVYAQVKDVFQSVLYEMWGKEGCFRDTDIICRKSLTSNVYYIFMNRSRGVVPLPLPGALEKVADRIGVMIQNELWAEMFAPQAKRRLPECVTSLPFIGVGFCGVIHNPCLEIHDIIEAGIEESRQVANAQLRRVRDRQRELMQTLIQAKNYLFPNYQGVFDLQKLTREHVDRAREEKSIGPLSDVLYGFEALIRVNKEAVEADLVESGTVGIDPKYLRPDVLFAMAKTAKVSLELDQACLRNAELHSRELPGTLMVNILPRNLYHIDSLRKVFGERRQVIFEVSESEDITNFDLMLKSRDILTSNAMGIAADDFGKGYASLERIIKIRPDLIKFDRSMIQDIHADPIKQAYVRGLVHAGKILKTAVLAEGVEKWEEAEVLQAMGVDYIQGFLLHRPQESAKILEQLRVGVSVARPAA